ncbi:MAG: PAS domain-containing protein [Clostridia bacterium]|nr:PAS domain-containing protein [Clostridia bacterium]
MDTDKLTEIWAKFIYEDYMDPRVQPPVAESWRKCKAAGINPSGGLGRRVGDNVFASIRAANKTLIETALPIMQSVFEIVERSHFLLVLTDSVGYILEYIGDETIISRTLDMRFVPGALWSNLGVGTNAISVALDCDTAIQMVGPEHYCRSHHGWTCSAAPIHGVDGEIIGCLNMSGDVNAAHDHTLGLVLAAAYGIEAQLSLLRSAELMKSALEGSADSIVLLDMNYKPIWVNSTAERLLGASSETLMEQDFRKVIPDVNFAEQPWAGKRKYYVNDTRILTGNATLHCSVVISASSGYGGSTLTLTLKKQKHLIDSVNKVSGNRASYTFEDIYSRDPAMKKTLALAQKYAHYDGNILIEGESGTGKELVAQAMHNAGSRAGGPFVAVNCASIPRDLLESELFGYEAGAFIGTTTEGNPGRFELANRGTLFLDEIAELPLEFQSKLLRAVESHNICRLGGGQDIKLDIRIIVSSNRSLEQAVAAGCFRQDLYYRLNVLKLEIPPLRSRPGDISYCAEQFISRLNSLNPEMEKSMSPDFISGLIRYDWPGNVRELQNGLERAFYSSSEQMLTDDCLKYVIGTDNTVPPPPLAEEAGEILAALTVCGGDVGAAAKRLNTSRATLYRRIKKYAVNPKSLK